MRTPEADRFQHDCEVPDPPLSPKGRQRYWDETVFEAVAELRKRLRSQDSEVALEALTMILDLEKTRIRHAAKVSGTPVPNLRDLEDDWGNPVRTGERRDVSPPVQEQETSPPVPLSVPERGCSTHRRSAAPAQEVQHPTRFHQHRDPLEHPLSVSEWGPGGEVSSFPRIPGVTACFSDRDDDWTRDPARSPPDDTPHPGAGPPDDFRHGRTPPFHPSIR